MAKFKHFFSHIFYMKVTPLRITLLYLLVGFSWILLSDRVIVMLVQDIFLLSLLQTFKGWLYVLVTGLLLYWLIWLALQRERDNQAALLQSEANLRAIFENTLQAFLLIDRQQRIQAFNQVANELAYMALKRPLRVGEKAPDTFGGNWRQSFADRFDAVMQGERITVQRDFAASDGSPLWFEINYNPVEIEGGEVVGLSMSVLNITERKLAEQQREALITELEARNAELERFNYTVSHDLRSPLISIKGTLGLLEADMAADDAEQIAIDLTDIRRAANEMEALLEDLLQLSRIGRMQNPPTAVAMSDLARRAADMLRVQINQRRADVQIAGDMPIVIGDETQLLEVWQNLIDNALKFMGEQTGPVVEIGAQHTKPFPTFYVRDNGIGIPVRYRQKIFNLFERLDSQVAGTGIGLSIVARIIDVHNGKIWVESTPETSGSTFYFTLPPGGSHIDAE